MGYDQRKMPKHWKKCVNTHSFAHPQKRISVESPVGYKRTLTKKLEENHL